MQLNPMFISNIQDLYRQEGNAWLQALPSQIQKLCEKHGLSFLKPMPGLTYNFVGLVEIKATGEKAILKIAPRQENIAVEAKWLQSFSHGVPKVYWYDEQQYAFLMEYLVPGTALKAMALTDDDKATRIICQTIRDLQSHQRVIPEGMFKHLSQLAQSLDVLNGKIDNKLLAQAKTWFKDLTTDTSHDVLLHGDLHHDNILLCGESYKAIDPHGYIGDAAFEVGPMIYNPGGEFFPTVRSIAQTIDRRLQILYEELPFDKQQIKAWTFCMTLLSIAWTVEDHGVVPEFEIIVANEIVKI